MNNLEKSQQQPESCTQEFKSTLQLSIATAFERTGTVPYNVDTMINDITTEFKHKDLNTLLKAIRNGALGMYGKTYKLTTQEVCIWIREYIREEGRRRYLNGDHD